MICQIGLYSAQINGLPRLAGFVRCLLEPFPTSFRYGNLEKVILNKAMLKKVTVTSPPALPYD